MNIGLKKRKIKCSVKVCQKKKRKKRNLRTAVEGMMMMMMIIDGELPGLLLVMNIIEMKTIL